MSSAPVLVVLDANVLFPFSVRDTLNEAKDRHVAAVAVKAGAQLIVTRNLRDFYKLPEGAKAIGPDDFLLSLLALAPGDMIDLLQHQAAALKQPAVKLIDLLTGLGKTVPRFEAAVRDLINPNDLHEG